MASIGESEVEDAALEWLAGLGYTVLHGPVIGPEGPASERGSYDDVLLAGRLRRALARLNPDLPAEQWHSDKFFWRSDKKAPALRAVAGSRGPCLLAGFGVRRVPGSATCSLAVSTAVHSCARAFRAGCTATGRT